MLGLFIILFCAFGALFLFANFVAKIICADPPASYCRDPKNRWNPRNQQARWLRRKRQERDAQAALEKIYRK